MLDSLPNRPLTNAEAESLKRQDGRIIPLSILKGGDDPYVIYSLAVYRNEAELVSLVGYSEDAGGWIIIETFDEDEWTVDRNEEVLQDWIDDEYGDELEQSWLDEDGSEVSLSP